MIRRVAASVVVALACQTAHPAYAIQDTLSQARALYLAADYEGALALLDRLAAGDRSPRADAAEYRVFCLLALDRSDEARATIKSLVEADPLYRLSDVQVSPRMQTAFHDIRKAVLPEIVQQLYHEAKASYERRDPASAQQFDRLLALLDDPDLKDAQLSDLRAVASGFRELSKAAGATTEIRLKPDPTDPPDPSYKPAPTYDLAHPLTGPPDRIRVTPKGSSPLFVPKEPPPAGVDPPVAVFQPVPSWSPRGMAAQQNYSGIVEVTIDERGNVTTVALQQAMQPAFDKALLKVARTWKFKPALLNGTPVPFVKIIEIQIEPGR
jgi:TonB family protein